jgi:hypothetical protein
MYQKSATPLGRALREFLEHWLGTTLTSACGTDEQSQRRYFEDLAAAGWPCGGAGVFQSGDRLADTHAASGGRSS